jgi:hypothetical protein
VDPEAALRLSRLLLGLAVAVMVAGVGANALGLLEEEATRWIAVAGLALLVASQGLRGWVHRTARPVLVLALASILLALVLFDVF